jgi:hypothetical protein
VLASIIKALPDMNARLFGKPELLGDICLGLPA